MAAQTDLLITGGIVVTMNQERQVFAPGAVAIQGRRITWVGPAGAAEVQAERTLDAAGQVVIPGLVNAHSHLAMTLFRGLADDLPLEPWLAHIWQVEYDYATAENTRLGTQLALAEMIRGGVTCATDMYWHTEANTEAAVEAGFRLVNGPTIARFTHAVGQRHGSSLEQAREFLARYQNHPLVHLCLQVHAIYTTPTDVLDLAQTMAEEQNLLFVTHAAESQVEVETVRGMTGMRPIEYLHSRGLLTRRTLLVHCVHLTDDEIAKLAEGGTSVAHCPESNLKLGNGAARVPDLLRAGVNVALGTDGAATNNDLDVFGEMRTAALLHKGVSHDPTALPAHEAFAMATIAGARALGVGDLTGSLEPGKLADVTLVDLDAPSVTPLYNIYSHLAYAVSKSDVRTVIINGRPVMEDRRLLTLDEDAIKARARAVAEHIGAGVPADSQA